MCMGEVGNDVTVFSALWGHTAWNTVALSKDFNLEPVFKFVQILGVPARRCRVKERLKPQQNCFVWCKNLCRLYGA